MTGLAIVAGRLMPVGEARVPLMDRGFLVGDGLFETTRVHHGRIHAWDQHMNRLERGAQVLGFPDPALARQMVAEAAARLIDAAAERHGEMGADLRLRMQATLGAMPAIGKLDEPSTTVHVTGFCTPSPLPTADPAAIRTTMADHVKRRADPWSTVKSLSYLPNLLVRRQAVQAGFDDALVCNDAGRFAEATTANLIALNTEHRQAWAPGGEEAALPGVTRALLVDHLRGDGWEVSNRCSHEDLARADVVLLSNATQGIRRVASIEDRDIPAGPAARSTAVRLQRVYLDSVRGGPE